VNLVNPAQFHSWLQGRDTSLGGRIGCRARDDMGGEGLWTAEIEVNESGMGILPIKDDTMNPQVQLDRESLAEFCRKWRIQELSLFGSALRDDFGPESDLDFLVSFEPGASWDLWDLVTMRDDLMSIVGREVDIVAKEALRNPYRRKEILSNREVIHAA
jgi:hypothetical protein